MEWCKVERRSFAKNVIKFPLSQSLELVESLMWADKEVDNNSNFITLLWYLESENVFLEKKYFEYLTQNNKIKTGSFKVIKKITKCIQKTKHTSKQGLSMKSGSGTLICAVLNQITLFSNGSDVCVCSWKREINTFQFQSFSSSCLFLILRRIVEWLGGKTQSCRAQTSLKTNLAPSSFYNIFVLMLIKFPTISWRFYWMENLAWSGDSVAATSPGRANND